jgi:3'-5' exoribonuclease
LTVKKSIGYTTEGRLLGHISLGYEMISEKVNGIPGFPRELAMLVKHIILSHHGEYEYGSPKRPKIQEAIVINYLDDLCAKLNNFQSTLKKENVAAGEWTGFSKMHDRYLYRQAAHTASAEGPEEAGEVRTPAAKTRKTGHSAGADPSGKLPLDI